MNISPNRTVDTARPASTPTAPTWLIALLSWGCVVGASLSWQAVFTTTPQWWLPVAFTCACISVNAAIARWLADRFERSTLLSVLGGLMGLVVGLTVATTARHDALAGLIPTPSSINSLAQLVNEGLGELRSLQAPTASSAALIALVCLLTGLVMLACDFRALTQGKPALVGLFALVLFLSPTMLNPSGRTVWGFISGAVCYLLLLSTSRLSPQESAAERIATTASWRTIAVATVVPVLLTAGVAQAVVTSIPQLTEGLVSFERPKNRTVTVTNPILDLRQDLTERTTSTLLTYTSTTGEGEYLRLMGLDLFDGQQWNFTNPQVPEDHQISNGLPLEPTNVTTQSGTTTISVKDLNSKWLPLPYTAVKASVDPSWIYDHSTRNVFTKFEEGSTSSVGSYTVEQIRLQPTSQQLRQAPPPSQATRRFLELPANLPPTIAQLAHEHSQNAPTSFDKAMALQTWLRTFTYDIKAPSTNTGQTTLEQFFQTQRGFCVHFSSAMAVMARTLDIPSRVAVGYLPGTNEGTHWKVTNREAHAWPELYFQGVGWVPFEPTPANRAPLPSHLAENNFDDQESQPFPPEQEQPSDTQPEPEPQDPSPDDQQEQEGAATQETHQQAPPNEPLTAQASLMSQPWVRWLAGGLLTVMALALLLAAPRMLGLLLRRRRWSQAHLSAEHSARAAASQLRSDSRDYAIIWKSQESPRQFTSRALATMKATSGEKTAGSRLCQLIEQWQYAPRITAHRTAAQDVSVLRQGWHRHSSTWQRLRATWFPASVLHQLRHGKQ